MIESDEISPALRAEITRDLGQLHDARRRRLGLFSLLGLGITLGFGFAMGLAAPPGWPFFTSLVVFAVAGVALAAFAFGLRLPTRRRRPGGILAERRRSGPCRASQRHQ